MSSKPKRRKKNRAIHDEPKTNASKKSRTTHDGTRMNPSKKNRSYSNKVSKKKKTKKKNVFTNFLLLILFLIALALIFNVQIRNFLIQKNGQAYSLDKITAKEIEDNNKKDVLFDFEAVESLSTEAVVRAQFQNKNLPVIGAVAIPDLKINLPIFRGLDNVVLLTGAGTMKAEQKMGTGNYALASHRVQDMVSLFSPLEYAQTGQLIYITDLTTIYTYEMTAVNRVDPSRVDLIDDVPDKNMVTLITCGDMNATTRIVVQGELKASTPNNEASQIIVDAFNMTQLTL